MVVVRRNIRDNQENVIDKNKNWIVTVFDSSKKQGDKKGELPSDVTRAPPNTNKGGRAVTPNGNSSTDKDTESSPSPQENRLKNSTKSAVESASAEVETSPSEAQKKVGNYKMGHVKVGAFDVTIENPRGSERSGTDANGKKWSVKMNNVYGYILLW